MSTIATINNGEVGSSVRAKINTAMKTVEVGVGLTGDGTVGDPLVTTPYYNKGFELIAHRGFQYQAPENTMLAFTSAMSAGADSLETDVQVSSDGVLYLFHDATVDALTSGTGAMSSLTSATVDTLTFDALVGSEYADVKIPLFSDFLDYAKENNIFVYPEIKNYRTTADITLMVQAVVDAGMENLCMLQSFSLVNLQTVRSLNSNIQIGYLGNSTSGYITDFTTLAGEGLASILWSYSSLTSTPVIVTDARALGLDVGTWTVPSNTELKKLGKIGVYKIMTNVTLGDR